MSYENPEVPHDVNVAPGNHLIEFLRLAAALVLLVLLAAAVLYLAGGQLARFIPFATEQRWVGDRVIGVKIERNDSDVRLNQYLQQVTDSLSLVMHLPDGMRIRVHVISMKTPNAFATLGGHIVLTRELFDLMPSENALAMVIAHEIAHVKHRDPISALGGTASLGLLLAVIGGDASSLAPQVAMLVQRGYTREAERRADLDAIAALQARYGHAGGAAAVFELLAATHADEHVGVPTLLSTHPTDAERIGILKGAARDWRAENAPLVPLGP
ncbi:MAG: M48 family metallopeptidase [Pseudomonadales bacterium]|nr:M48 family metallopeptidase [Pseudomonadales bacterium]